MEGMNKNVDDYIAFGVVYMANILTMSIIMWNYYTIAR